MTTPNLNANNVRKALTRKKLQAFLDAAPPEESAGECGNSAECAVSVYIKSVFDLDLEDYGISTYRRISIVSRDAFGEDIKAVVAIPIPSWALQFIFAFDRGTAYTRTNAETAEILRNLKVKRT